MIKTNLELWNFYKAIIDTKAETWMQSVCPVTPASYFEIELSGKVQEKNITGRYYAYEFKSYFTGKKPTKVEVKEISKYSLLEINFKPEKLYFSNFYTWDKENNYTAKSAIAFKDLFSSEKIFLSLEDATIKAEETAIIFEAKKLFKEIHKKDANYNYAANGYKFLGWQNGWKHVYFDKDGQVTDDPKKRATFGYLKNDYPEFINCSELKHQRIEVKHNQRGSENTVSCPVCKIYWKYDCSD